ncbi:MAG: hypothetical protein HY553_11500 [Elusimicrobia bacterium]|nr:hypothetical protein [Elusimicrobiota bacterium]
MNEPMIQVRRTVPPDGSDRRLLILAALLSLGGGASGAVFALWTTDADGARFSVGRRLEAPRPLFAARPAAAWTAAGEPLAAAGAARRRGGPRNGSSLAALGASRAAAEAQPTAARSAPGAAWDEGKAMEWDASGSLKGRARWQGPARSQERSSALAGMSAASGRSLYPRAAATRPATVVRGAAAEARLFRSDSGNAWRLLASNPSLERPTDLRDAPSAYGAGPRRAAGENAGDGLRDEEVRGRSDLGQEARGIDWKLARVKDAGESQEVEGLESSALLSRMDDESRRQLLRVLETGAENGVTGLEACRGANVTPACMEAMRRCNADEACRRRYTGR